MEWVININNYNLWTVNYPKCFKRMWIVGGTSFMYIVDVRKENSFPNSQGTGNNDRDREPN
jgi:hypothetical protein